MGFVDCDYAQHTHTEREYKKEKIFSSWQLASVVLTDGGFV